MFNHRLTVTLCGLQVVPLMMMAPQPAHAQSRFLAPFERYEPRQEQVLLAELMAIAGQYRRTNIANCDEAYGPLSGADMRSLLFYRQANFERFRWTSSSQGGNYTWYISEGSDENYLCGEGKVYCQPLYVCRSGPVRLVRGSDRLVALGERLREMDIGLGVQFRFKTCNQSISKFRQVEVLLKNPGHVRNMANSAFATNVVASAVHFADRLCHDDGFSYSYPNVRSDRRDRSGYYDPYGNIEVSVIDGTRPYDSRAKPVLRIRTKASGSPGTIRISESDGWQNVPRLTGFVLADVATFTARPVAATTSSSSASFAIVPVAIKPSMAGGIVWGIPRSKDIAPPTGATAQSTDNGLGPVTTSDNATSAQIAIARSSWPYAVLSNAVYRNGSEIDPPADWAPVTGYTDRAGGGFYAEVWKKTERDKVIEVALVFRGTDGAADWTTGNMGFAQQQLAKQLANQVKAENPGVTITATGHSLGGALAKVAAAQLGGQAVVFNSSPRGPSPEKLVNIAELGDVLALPRAVAGTPATGSMVFNFTIGSQDDNHSIYRLAVGLKQLAD